MQLTAYNVKTKEKNVPIQEAVVTKTARGGYMVQGNDGKGNKLTALVGDQTDMLLIDIDLVGQLDFIFSKARLAHVMKATMTSARTALIAASFAVVPATG